MGLSSLKSNLNQFKPIDKQVHSLVEKLGPDFVDFTHI